MAGQVRAKGEARRTRSDFMKMEQDRGISVSASAMSFAYADHWFNLVDTPGHADFSEDTYRTLTAVDAAIMVIDGAKGVESQTRKLFEVCRLRDLPILTFCNKMDRESRDTFDIIDEIQESAGSRRGAGLLADRPGPRLHGRLRSLHDRLETDGSGRPQRQAESISIEGLDDPRLDELIPAALLANCARRLRWPANCCPASTSPAFVEGQHDADLVRLGDQLLRGARADAGHRRLRPAAAAAPDRLAPGRRRTKSRSPASSSRCRPTWTRNTGTALPLSGFAVGHFTRGMKLRHVRAGKPMAISNPVLFLAAEREMAEDAWAGDIIGIPNHGQLRIGDALTEGEDLRFTGIPAFAPELLQNVRAGDPMKAKHLDKALLPVRRGGRGQAVQARGRRRLDRRRRRPCSSTCWPAGSS